jgi:hypothetical protein
MSELQIETFTMPASNPGPENPLPPFKKVTNVIVLNILDEPVNPQPHCRPRPSSIQSMVNVHSFSWE